MNKIYFLWDLSNLRQTQIQLDNYIHIKQKTNYEKTLVQRLLALSVELNELANETRCFKYWSIKKQIERQKILEEYVDGLHFCLSLLIYYDLNPKIKIQHWQAGDNESLTRAFWQLNVHINQISDPTTFLTWFGMFLELGFLLGFQKTEIEEVYYQKAKINFERQNNGY